VPDEEMLMALSPTSRQGYYGHEAAGENGLRYRSPYGIQADVRAGMGVSYGKK
jgi:hypothetical protein